MSQRRTPFDRPNPFTWASMGWEVPVEPWDPTAFDFFFLLSMNISPE